MPYFILSVLLNITIYQIFRQAGRHQIDLFGMLLANYLTCVAIGLSAELGIGLSSGKLELPPSPVWAWALGLGFIFIACFYLLARLTADYGAGVGSIVSRVSMVWPVLYFHYSEKEAVSPLAWLGLCLALASPWLLVPLRVNPGTTLRFIALVFMVFVGYGLIDIVLKLTERIATTHGVLPRQLTLYIFSSACAVGWLAKLLGPQRSLPKTAWIWGLALGLVNFFSIYLFIKALPIISIPLPLLYPLNGILILLGATLASIALFGERLTRKGWLGVAFAVGAIVLMSI